MKILIINILLLLVILSDILNFRLNDQKLFKKLDINQDRIDIKYYEKDYFNIRYVDVGEKNNRMVIFIHGAPGSLDAFLGFLNDSSLRRRVRMIAVDRPGYGYSNLGNALPSIKDQTSCLAPLLDINRHENKPIIVGHSYGGTIAASLAMHNPDKVGGILLVGPAVDPDHEKIFWVSYLLKLPWISLIFPASIMVSNIEKLNHEEELKKMLPDWGRIQIPVTILHGEKDGLVPVENAYFCDSMLTKADKKLVVKKNIGHLIPWTHPELMKKEIFDMLEQH